MTNTNYKKNMYFSEDNYTTEYDGTTGNWEDEYDSIHSLTVVPETSVWKSFYRRPLAQQPIQLAAKSSKFSTLEEAKEFYTKKFEQEFEEAETMLAVEKENAALEELKKELEKKKEFEKEPLPFESESFKQKREEAEKLLREEAEAFRAKIKAEQQQGNVWGHRRNGGGKKGRRNCKETADEVIQARRSLHRKKVKDQKKVEAEARAVKFAAEAAKVVVPTPKPVVELDEEEVEMRKLILSKIEEKPENVALPPSSPSTPTATPTPTPPPTPPPSPKPVSPPVRPPLPPMPLVETCVEVEEEGWEVVKKKEKKEVKEVKPENREEAIEVLADQSKMRQQLKRTKMCISVSSGKTCPHGVNCRFAHSPDELSISDCFFGTKCRFVCCKNGVFENTGNKPCQHRHPEETEDNYFKRTGLPDFRPKTIPTLETPKMNKENFPILSTPAPPPPPTKWVKPPTITPDATKPRPATTAVKFPPPPPPPELEREETVIKVPKELAVQAMEMALASGKKLIRIEII